MEIYRKPKPKLPDGSPDKRKVRYKGQAALDSKYQGVKGCRYRINGCYESFRWGKCCHTCPKEDSCKDACLSTIEDCQSVFDEEVVNANTIQEDSN